MVTILRFRWAAWVAGSVPEAEIWAAAAATLLAARLRFVAPPSVLPLQATRVPGLPGEWANAGSPAVLMTMVPRSVGWVLDGVTQASDLWTAEARWWSRVRRDASETMVRSQHGAPLIVAVVALLAYDAWLTRAALASAARGPWAREAFDAVA